jgi:Fur family iron response transcriptional regulator
MNTNEQKQQLNYPLSRDAVVHMLKDYDISPTRQRIEIASYLFQRPQHLSADRILEGVNVAGHRVSRATVYNTMGLFSKKGLIREVLIDRERVFYDSNNSQHHHLYNVDSGELKDLDAAQVELMVMPELEQGASIVSTDVIIKISSK